METAPVPGDDGGAMARHVPRQSPDLPTIELKLADDIPFGSYEYLAGKLAGIYAQFLAFLAQRSDAARQFAEALDGLDAAARKRVFHDALTRRTIEDGVCLAIQGIDTIDPAMLEVLLAAAARSAATKRRTLLDSTAVTVPLGDTPDYGFVWADDRYDTLPAQRFRDEILKRLPGFQIVAPTQEQIDTLIAGVRLADRITPSLARSAISHNFMVVIGVFEDRGQRFNSLTMPGLPGVVFLSPDVLISSATAAEAFFHETVHLKFLDIDYIHPLFVTGFRQERSPRITPVWHSDKPGYGDWPVDRVLTSMHVYLALTVYLGTASDGSHDGLPVPKEYAMRAAQCRTRAGWLFDNARTYPEILSPAGHDFVTSIGAMLADLDRGQKDGTVTLSSA
jgi:hypothetical protein